MSTANIGKFGFTAVCCLQNAEEWPHTFEQITTNFLAQNSARLQFLTGIRSDLVCIFLKRGGVVS